MKNLCLSLILMGFSLPVFSQADILLRGKIIIAGPEETSIHIINSTQNTGTTSVPGGAFEIRVRENDTLFFTAVQYERQVIIISPEVYQEKFLTVVLVEAVNQMEEVNISNLKLTGRLSTDLDEIKTVNKYKLGIPLSTKPLPTQQDRRIYTATSTSLDLLLNVLSGRLKKLKEEREISQLVALIRRAEESLPDDFYTEFLGLRENEVVNFLYYCAENSDLRKELSSRNKITLMEYYREMKELY